MSVRSSGYDNDILDEVLCYFMRTILNLQETGIERLPLENNLPEPVRSYMELAMKLFTDGQPPEISRIILESEYDVLLHRGRADIGTVLCLRMIKNCPAIFIMTRIIMGICFPRIICGAAGRLNMLR